MLRNTTAYIAEVISVTIIVIVLIALPWIFMPRLDTELELKVENLRQQNAELKQEIKDYKDLLHRLTNVEDRLDK